MQQRTQGGLQDLLPTLAQTGLCRLDRLTPLLGGFCWNFGKAGGRQDVMDQVPRRVHLGQRPQQQHSLAGLGEQGSAGRATLAVGVKGPSLTRCRLGRVLFGLVVVPNLCVPNLCFQEFGQKSLELAALKPVFAVLSSVAHWLACPLLRESNRASSVRPRLMRDFTVPSGTRKTLAMSL